MTFSLNQSFAESMTIALDLAEVTTVTSGMTYLAGSFGTSNAKITPSNLAVGKVIADGLPAASTWFPILVNGNGAQKTYFGGTSFYMDSSGRISGYRFNADSPSGQYQVNGIKVVGAQQPAISNASVAYLGGYYGAGAAYDECDAKINSIIAALESHGLIAS